jgi:hypothetical protein
MEGKRRKEWPVLVIVAAILLLLAPPALYLVGYFWLADVEEGYWVPDRTPVVHRTFGAKWLAQAYEPAGRIEERITNREVEIGYEP